MIVTSVNVGKAVAFEHTTPGITGIFKEPQLRPVHVGTLGLEDDAICDTAHHGGPDQAVYLYGVEDYSFWTNEIGRLLPPGTFGENLTVVGLESAKINIGDRFVLGSLIMEVTSPRIPCRTFAARMEDKYFVKKFLDAGRPGIYCRVLSAGPVRAGDALSFVPFEGEQVSVIELNTAWKNMDLEPSDMQRFLATPVHFKLRQKWEALLG